MFYKYKTPMIKKYSISLLTIILFVSPVLIQAQKDQIPLAPQLENSSERQLIKIGMITQAKPAKVKFGEFSTDNRKGHSTTEGDDASNLDFSFDLINGKGDMARVEASSNMESTKSSKEIGGNDEISIYITTSLDKDDLWVLLVTRISDNKDLSLNNIFLTNGDDEITFKHVVGMPTNKSEVTAPKGIEVLMNDYPIAAMQYYSGGSFSYKKFIWISEKTEPQLQLVMAAVFSAMLELGNYFEDSGFID